MRFIRVNFASGALGGEHLSGKESSKTPCGRADLSVEVLTTGDLVVPGADATNSGNYRLPNYE